MATRTARETITAALRRMGIIDEEETPTAAQATSALALLNDMMQGWPAEGIQYVHETLTLDSVLNVPDEQTRNVSLVLIDELADSYGKEIPQRLQMVILAARQALQAAYYEVPPAQVDRGLTAPYWPGYTNLRNL